MGALTQLGVSSPCTARTARRNCDRGQRLGWAGSSPGHARCGAGDARMPCVVCGCGPGPASQHASMRDYKQKRTLSAEMTASAISYATSSCASLVDAPRWGVQITSGRPTRGLSEGGGLGRAGQAWVSSGRAGGRRRGARQAGARCTVLRRGAEAPWAQAPSCPCIRHCRWQLTRRRRLDLEHVERGARHDAGVQRTHERVVVNHAAARHVDDARALLHLRAGGQGVGRACGRRAGGRAQGWGGMREDACCRVHVWARQRRRECAQLEKGEGIHHGFGVSD